MANRDYSFKQLLEMDACTGCLACADVCPAVMVSGDGRLSSAYRLGWQRRNFKARGGILRRLFGPGEPQQDHWEEFSQTVYRCTLCGNCQEVCPAGIHLREMWLSLRSELVDKDAYPKKIDAIRENLVESHNVFDEDNEDRTEWVEDLDDPPDHGFIKDTAQVVYFTGCVASFFPLAQQIPIALAEILQAAGVDFTLLGEDEWCCGFPLLGAGALDEAQKLIQHNLEAIRAKKAWDVVFACPSCYQMFREHYPTGGLRLFHATQYLEHLITSGRLNFKPRRMKVTYHDPCDLGRGAREFEAPRRVIQALPGVELVEMERNRENALCCGGGGNLEMIDKDLNAGIAQRKIEMALATGAEAVITSCQQCVRTMATYTRRNKIPLKVMDITQLVRSRLDRQE